MQCKHLGATFRSLVLSLGLAATGCGNADPPVKCDARAVTPLAPGAFTDISAASGIQANNFVPNPTTPIPINDHSRLGFADLDGDGYDDIVAHSLFPNPQKGIPFEHLVFLNNHDGTFRDFSDESGLRKVQAGFLVFADVDNDGDQDCFAGLDIVLDNEHNRLFLNDGAGHFTEKADAGVDGTPDATTGNAVFADFDADGKLDLFLGNGQTSYAASDQLYLGDGTGHFTEVTGTNLLSDNPGRPTNGLVACDYDNDGDQDLFVSTYGVSIERGHDLLWENDGHGNFTDVAHARGTDALATGNYWLATTGNGTTPEPGVDPSNYMGGNGFGIDCADVDGDGNLDIYQAQISHPVDSDYSRKWSDPTTLYINGGAAAGFAFDNQFLAKKLPFNEGDIDNAIIDFDNDGRMDLSVTRDNKYEGGYTGADQKSWLGLFHQLADGTFESVGLTSGINDPNDTTALPRMKAGQNLAWSDIDHDGDLDLLVGGRDHGGGRANLLFRNEVGSQNAWLAIRLRGDGKKVNRDAIGARVTIKGGGKTLIREVKSSRGTYDSMDGHTLSFGLGDLGCDFTLEVRWPDGTLTQLTGKKVPMNRYVTIDYALGFLPGE